MQLHSDPAIDRTSRFTLLALLYLEQQGLVPERFTPGPQAAWHGIMPYARVLDLFELAARDGVRANPHLFARLVDNDARNELRTIDESSWRQELGHLQSLALGHMPVRQLYRLGAEVLGVNLPAIDESLLQNQVVDRSSLIAELPNGCGFPSLLFCQMYDLLDAAHNLRIFAEGPETEMLAAWAMVLLTGQLILPADRIIAVSATSHAALARESFDVALVYRPVKWLPSQLTGSLSARKVIAL